MKKTNWNKIIKVAVVAMLCLAFVLALGCKQEEAVAMKVGALKGPTGMGLAYMMEQADSAYESIELYDAPDAITGKFISGELDIAAVPINLASTLYNRLEGDVRMLAVNTLGVLYILENGDTVQSLADLSGKTVYATAQGSTTEYVLSGLLNQAGVTDVTVEFVGEHAALATMMAAGEATIAMLPEPNVSAVLLKNADVRIALDLNDQWNQQMGNDIVQGCYIAKASFVEAHPAAVAQFLKDCGASVERVNDNGDAAVVIAEQGILPSEAVAAKAIPNCNIVCLTGDAMYQAASGMLQTLYEANPKSVGGALPGNDLYGK